MSLLLHLKNLRITAGVELFDNNTFISQIVLLDFKIENELIFSTKLYTIIVDKNGVETGFKARLNKIIKSF